MPDFSERWRFVILLGISGGLLNLPNWCSNNLLSRFSRLNANLHQFAEFVGTISEWSTLIGSLVGLVASTVAVRRSAAQTGLPLAFLSAGAGAFLLFLSAEYPSRFLVGIASLLMSFGSSLFLPLAIVLGAEAHPVGSRSWHCFL